MSALVIAEAGVNHNGSLDLAVRLAEAAAAAGADYVKFQTFKAERLVTLDAPKARYQAVDSSEDPGQLAMLRALELSEADHLHLRDRCESLGIRFLSTGFDMESLDFLVDLGIDRVKVPSGELTNLPFLRHVAGLRLPVILSTGMARMDEVGDALDALAGAGCPKAAVTVLQCTTAYPTPFSETNLRAMHTIRDAFDVSVGFSDHTPGIEASVAAVALGASVIEKHVTLDRSLPGPDHAASLEPDELADLVRSIRNVEAALGDGLKAPSPSEIENMVAARKSIVATASIRSGDRFDSENVGVMRPGDGLSPMRWDEVIGAVALRDYAPGDRIEL